MLDVTQVVHAVYTRVLNLLFSGMIYEFHKLPARKVNERSGKAYVGV